MTRDEILSGMPDEIAQKVYDNMIAQGEWEDYSSMKYLHEYQFLKSSFTWDHSLEGGGYWSDYLMMIVEFESILTKINISRKCQ